MSTSFKSLKDASYQGCISNERSTSIGQYVYDKCPSFLEAIPEEVKAEIEEIGRAHV